VLTLLLTYYATVEKTLLRAKREDLQKDGFLSALLLAFWHFELKIGTPITPALSNVHTIFVFFLFELRARIRDWYGRTNKRADGWSRPAIWPPETDGRIINKNVTSVLALYHETVGLALRDKNWFSKRPTTGNRNDRCVRKKV